LRCTANTAGANRFAETLPDFNHSFYHSSFVSILCQLSLHPLTFPFKINSKINGHLSNLAGLPGHETGTS
jgi:hypothetical protein